MELKQTAYVILGILAIHPNQSGYEIRKTVQQTVGFFWGESYGQIYPTLKALLAAGLIEKSGKAPTSGRAPQLYSITPAGMDAQKKWLAVPFVDTPPRDEFLLKLFFAQTAGPTVAREQVQQFADKNRKLLATLEDLRTRAEKVSSHYPGYAYWTLTLKYGIKLTEMNLAWSEHAQRTLGVLEDDLRKMKQAAAKWEKSQNARKKLPPQAE